MQEWANALIERCGSVLFLRFILGGAARACPHQFTDPYNDSMIIPLYINCMARIKYFFEYELATQKSNFKLRIRLIEIRIHIGFIIDSMKAISSSVREYLI